MQILLLLIIFLLLPARAFTATWADVAALWSSLPEIENCEYWIEKYELDGQLGAKVWKRCTSMNNLAFYHKYTYQTTQMVAGTTIRVNTCELGETGYTGRVWIYKNDIYWKSTEFTVDRYNCFGQYYETYLGIGSENSLHPSPCLLRSANHYNCKNLDTLIENFYPVLSDCNYDSLDNFGPHPDRIFKSLGSVVSDDGSKEPCNNCIPWGTGPDSSNPMHNYLENGAVQCRWLDVTGDPGKWTDDFVPPDSGPGGQGDDGGPRDHEFHMGDDAQCPSINAPTNSATRLSTGNLYHDQFLLKPDFPIHYNSYSTRPGPLGNGWTHDYNISVSEDDGSSLVLRKESGNKILFWYSNGAYYPEARFAEYSTIVKNGDGSYTRTTKEGIVYNFDISGKLVSIVDRNGNATTFGYTDENLTSITDANGRIIQLAYDENNRIVQLTSHDSQDTTLAYDQDGHLITVTDPANFSWSYTYDAEGRMLTKTDPAGNTTTYAYDDRGRLTSSIDAEAREKAFSYNHPARTTSVTERDGGIWNFKYESARDLVLEMADPLGNITKYEYDEDRNLTKVINPDDTYSTYTYDSYGNLLGKTDELGQNTQFTYNSFGQITSETDATGTIYYNYDASGNLISYVDALGATTEFQYDSKGNLVSVTDPADNTTTLAYDSYNNLISITDPANAVTAYTYDSSGRRLTETDASGAATSYDYDVLGRLTTITRPGNAVTQIAYDPNGNVTTLTDANGKTTSYAYNSDNLVTSETNALDQVTTYDYGSTGCGTCGGGGVNKLTALTDARDNMTNFTYDQRGKVLTETDPLGKTYSYSYDSRGNLTARTDANGAVTDYAYDSLNRLTGVSYPGGASASYGYNSKDLVTSAANDDITYTITYDANGRMTSVLDSNGRTIEYTYDTRGNRTGMTTPDGRVIQYAYDQRNRLTHITSSAGPAFAFVYDDVGRRTSLAYSNGVTAAYTYDNRGSLTGLVHENSSSVSIDSFSYTLDNVGNRLSRADMEYQYDYAYNSVYRLTQSQPAQLVQNPVFQQSTEDFTYDPVGNRLTGPGQAESYEYNAGNQLTIDHKRQFGYDNNGNLISKTEQDGGSTTVWTYGYDYENRLVSVTRELVGNPEIDAITFKYDPFGRRIGKNVSTYENGLPTTYDYVYVYDNEDIILEILERTHDGNVTTTTTAYTHGPGIDEPLAMERGGQTYYFHADGLGSITSITDGAEAVVNRYAYDSFGIRKASETVRNAYAFTGREWDSETSLYYYRARYYDPEAGRFIGKDPIGFAGGDVNVYGYVDSVGKPLTETNLYAYTGNSPVNRIDPLGLYWEYSQSTGQMTYVDNQTGARTPLGTGYSGNGAGYNNPNMQNVPFVGPIPQGAYDIGGATTTRGPLTLPLNPRPGIDTFGRDAFRIHGDNSCDCQSASSGCIILRRGIREQINNSRDRELRVVQ